MNNPSGQDQPTFNRRLAEMGAASDATWLTALSVGLAFTLIAAYGFPYPQSDSGKFWAYAGLLIRSSLYLGAGQSLRRRGGEALRALFAMGLVAGSFEILVDWVLIHGVRSGKLIYLTGNDVVLLGSPVWMPVAWACVIVELGYPALRLFALLRNRVGDALAGWSASAVCAVSAGVTVGFYEYFAFLAGWWKYEPARWMIGKFCALYIPIGEALMFSALFPIASRFLIDEERPVFAALRAGALFAAAIAGGYLAAYVLLEGLPLP